MTPNHENLHCKVEVRKYVLVSQPSRWNQRGDRIVVQSPMLSIPLNVSHVPVKRFCGEENNSVCFIPRTDIEKDTSNIYCKARVSTTSSWVDSHGVALFDSAPSDEFEYKQNDRFWICLRSPINDDGTNVPVINLRTCKEGSVPINHVCWYPKIQGPGRELWTLGGEKRSLKTGTRNSFWSWVICQKLDGSKATTKHDEIPVKDTKMADRFILSSTERRALFEKRYQYMIPELLSKQRPHITCDERQAALMTPPSSPEIDDFDTWTKTNTMIAMTTLQSPAPPVSHMGWWEGVMKMVRHRKGPPQPLRGSPIHRRDPQSTRRSKMFQPLVGQNITWYHKKSMISTAIPPRTPSPASWLVIPELKDFEGPHHLGVTILMDMQRAAKSIEELDIPSPAFSITDPHILDGSTSIAERWGEKKATESYSKSEGAYIASLCDMRRKDCEYSSLFLDNHYHSPAAKCRLPAFTESRPHEHCVSQKWALPDRAGACVLSTLTSRSHSCCYWEESDRINWEPAQQRIYAESKMEEARKNMLKILDRSKMVKEIPEQVQPDMRFGHLFDEAGHQVFIEDQNRPLEYELSSC